MDAGRSLGRGHAAEGTPDLNPSGRCHHQGGIEDTAFTAPSPMEVNMDGSRFDRLTRHIGSIVTSRRGSLRILAATTLAALISGQPVPSGAKKKKVTLCHEGQTLSVSKKAKKVHLKHGDTLGECPAPPPPPPPGGGNGGNGGNGGGDGCPSGQKLCDGACIPSNQCCDNADCDIFGQTCNAQRQCTCPAAFPEICGGACLASCLNNEVRTADCRCCTKNFFTDLGSHLNCCSVRSDGNGNCAPRETGEVCTLHAACRSQNCVQGRCSSCQPGQDICRFGSSTCGDGGGCLTAVDGTTRCGSRLSSIECDFCSEDSACDQGQGLGYFCARSTGAGCTCPVGQTFCARPR
jgi:hypothetical protein